MGDALSLAAVARPRVSLGDALSLAAIAPLVCRRRPPVIGDVLSLVAAGVAPGRR